MRVVLLSTFQEPCGIATYTEDLVRALDALSVETLVLSPRERKGAAGWGDQPRLWNRNRAFGFEALRTFRAIEGHRPDLVHAQINRSLYSSRFLYSLGLLCARARLPLVATLHGRKTGSFGPDFKLWRVLHALRHADLVVHTDAHRAELGRDRVHVIRHGMREVRARPVADARAALGLDVYRRVLAHVGFLVPDKGVEEMIRAVHELRRAGAIDLFYWIAGGAYSSRESLDYFARLGRTVRELSLEEHVHLNDAFVDEERLALELEAANWIVLNYATGNAQGASGAARRALSSGRPVAVSRAPVFDDVREAVHTFQEPLAAAIPALFEGSLTDETRAKGRAFCERHSWRRVAERHVELYASILSRARKATLRSPTPSGVPKGPRRGTAVGT
jgi:glycosyltransferase involved in cell wall biosynthesis